MINIFLDIPPSYEEAIKIKPVNNPSQSSMSAPIHSISLAVDQAQAVATMTTNNNNTTTTTTFGELSSNRKLNTSNNQSQVS